MNQYIYTGQVRVTPRKQQNNVTAFTAQGVLQPLDRQTIAAFNPKFLKKQSTRKEMANSHAIRLPNRLPTLKQCVNAK